ncbi:MAG: response regulator [Polaromonas sp.]
MPTKARLLFVDDEERIVNLLHRMFYLTHEVFTARSGSEALKIIAAHDIQVIVSDQRMPGMSGLELLSTVRQRSPATLGILLADHSDLAAIAGSANEAGIFRFVNKPWNIEELKNVVHEASELAMRMHGMTLKPKPAPPRPDPVLPLAGAVDAVAAAATPALLVLVGSEIDRLEIMQMFADDYRVHGAPDVAKALKVIEQHDVGVIICEPHVCSKGTGPFLRVLTLNYPMVQTVMLTSAVDRELGVKMAHQMQIFRYVMKPIIRPRVLRFAVSAAMKEHRSLRSNPRIIRRLSAARATGPKALHW